MKAAARKKAEPTIQPSPTEQWVRPAAAAALLLAIALSFAYWLLRPSWIPSDDDYGALQRELVGAHQTGDGVALLPFWADRGKLFLRGLPLLALPHLAEEPDAERYRRLWVLSQPRLPRSAAPSELAALDQRLTRKADPKHFGPLALSLYEPKAGRAPSYDFRDRLMDAQVDVDGQPCEASGDGFRCPRGNWNYVRAEWHEFDFLPRRCLWAHPVGDEPLAIRFHDVPLTGGVRGGFGLIGPAGDLTAANYAPVDLAIDVDGAQAASLELGPGDPGWHPFELGVAGLAAGHHDVTFRVTTPNSAMRHFCFDAVGF